MALRTAVWREVGPAVHREDPEQHDDVCLSAHLGLDYRCAWDRTTGGGHGTAGGTWLARTSPGGSAGPSTPLPCTGGRSRRGSAGSGVWRVQQGKLQHQPGTESPGRQTHGFHQRGGIGPSPVHDFICGGDRVGLRDSRVHRADFVLHDAGGIHSPVTEVREGDCDAAAASGPAHVRPGAPRRPQWPHPVRGGRRRSWSRRRARSAWTGPGESPECVRPDDRRAWRRPGAAGVSRVCTVILSAVPIIWPPLSTRMTSSRRCGISSPNDQRVYFMHGDRTLA